MSLHKYISAQNATDDPRRTEYRLFAQVTRALMEARQAADFGSRNNAIHWNRRLWLTLQSDCASDGNRLPDELKAGIISLSIWVDKHSRRVLKGEADINPLIDVNRSIMEGLAA